MNGKADESRDFRRAIVGFLAAGLLLIFAVLTFWPSLVWADQAGSAHFAAAACGRIGLVMAALCLAWPSLRRPAQWLPPGIAVLGVGALAMVAAQPRLVLVILPAIGALTVLAGFVRAFRGKS